VPNIYLLDTSSLFDLKKFPVDVFPTLWANLDVLIAEGRLLSPHEAFREVTAGDDGIADWAKARRSAFVDLDEPTARCIEEVLGRFEGLRDTTRFGPIFADPVLVALCLARSRADGENKYFVVTEEKLRGPGALKIPNLCAEFGLTAIPLVEMFRREGFRY
jgi:hypothetical protein